MEGCDERSTGMHWQTQKHGAEHFRRARAANPEGRIPVAVAIGADPATALAGMLPIPPDLGEMMFAGFLGRGAGGGGWVGGRVFVECGAGEGMFSGAAQRVA